MMKSNKNKMKKYYPKASISNSKESLKSNIETSLPLLGKNRKENVGIYSELSIQKPKSIIFLLYTLSNRLIKF